MVVAATTAAFPVVLYDGEHETDVGTIEIHPDLAYRAFQIKLSQMIGISHNNLTTYLVDSKKPKTSPDRRKILITSKVNFGVIVQQKSCYFFVVLKRPRKDRRRKPSRDSNGTLISAYSTYGYVDRFHDLLNSEFGIDLSLNESFPRIEDAYPRVSMNRNDFNRSLCEECKLAQKKGKEVGFHLCVYDEVVDGGFRSPAGPISRRK